MSEPEYEAIRREVESELGLSVAEVEALAEAAELAGRMNFGKAREVRRGRVYVKEYVYLYYDSKEKLQEALKALQRIGYEPAVHRNKKRILA